MIWFIQGQINHWANRANARGLVLLRASRLNVKTFLLVVFHIFRLFTTRQNWRAFWLLRLVYRLRKLTTSALIVFEWLKIIEPNSTTFHDPRIRSKSAQPWASAEIFPMKTTSKFCLSFSGCWRWCKWTFTKRFTLSNSLVCGGWTSIFNLLSVMSSSFQLSEMLFLFINCLISISSTFYKQVIM